MLKISGEDELGLFRMSWACFLAWSCPELWELRIPELVIGPSQEAACLTDSVRVNCPRVVAETWRSESLSALIP